MSIAQIWLHIDKTRTQQDWIKSIEDWNKLEKLKNNHLTCNQKSKTKCCNLQLCDHLSDKICSTYSCCAWCDQCTQPMLANPINKRYVLKYCKLGSKILYPSILLAEL